MFGCLILCSIFVKQVDCFYLTNRIINGAPVTSIEEAPFVASLEWFGDHICGASIISRTKIITAAHCTKRVENVKDIKVRVGTILRFCNGYLFDVKAIYQHSNFDSKLDYDVSILDLKSPLPFNEKISNILLPKQNQTLRKNTTASIYGWGSVTEQFYDASNHLKTVQIKIIDYKKCKQFFPFISETMFCAGYIEGGKDACQGDSGGPLVVNGILVGIISFGVGCGEPNAPGVYTNVAKVRDFVDKFM